METILFSPLGNTDPITACHDGACLHILRHYRPQGVALFYTKEMRQKEVTHKHGQWYQASIQMLGKALQCEFPIVKEYDSEIVDAHKMDILFTVLPQAVNDVHRLYPKAQILLNTSSGTPQIKTILAMLAVEYPWCKAIQVAAPKNEKTGTVTHEKHVENNEDYDIGTLFETNLDNEENAPNRCSEPPLHTLRFFREKNQIESLIQKYEYAGAYMLSTESVCIDNEVKTLLKHAMYRQQLKMKEAASVLSCYRGEKLFPFNKEKQEICEYALITQINQEKGQLSEFLVKIEPFLNEVLLHYVKNEATFTILDYCDIPKKNDFRLRRKKLLQNETGRAILSYLDKKYYGQYKDTSLSYLLLSNLCFFMKDLNMARNRNSHLEVIKILENIVGVNQLRNLAAHQAVNPTEEKIKKNLNLSSDQLMNQLFQLLCLVYGDDCRTMRSFYSRLNTWIMKRLSMQIES